MSTQQALSDVRHAIHTVFKGAVESVMPLRTESAFKEKGVRARRARLHRPLPAQQQRRAAGPHGKLRAQVLTPEEFVASGDYLVRTCPTWSWRAPRSRPGPARRPPACLLTPWRSSSSTPEHARAGPKSVENGVRSWQACCSARSRDGPEQAASQPTGALSPAAAVQAVARRRREAGDPKKALGFLPADKQYLVTRNGAAPSRPPERLPTAAPPQSGRLQGGAVRAAGSHTRT